MANRNKHRFEAKEHQPARYRLRDDVTITSSTNPQIGQKQYYVKTAKTDEIFELGEEEYFFCVRLDGRVSFAEFRHAFESHFSVQLTFQRFEDFAEQLVGMQVLERTDDDAVSAAASALITDIFNPEDPDPRASFFRRTLLNPQSLFSRFANWRRAGRIAFWATWPLLAMALTIWAQQTAEVFTDFNRIAAGISIFLFIPTSLLTVNLLAKVVEGAVASAEGAKIRSLGLIFFLGFFPRFYIDQAPIMALNAESQRRVFGAALMSRLFMFSVCMVLWSALRSAGGVLPDTFLFLGHIAIAAFIVTSAPFINSDGYHWMVTLFGKPDLRQRSMRYLRMRLSGKASPTAMQTGDKLLALLFAAICILFSCALVIVIFALIATNLESSMGGAGVVIFFGILSIAYLWYRMAQEAASRVRENMRANIVDAATARPSGGLVAANQRTDSSVIKLKSANPPPRPAQNARLTQSPATSPKWPQLLRLGALIAVLIILFMPYQYKPGGEFEVLANKRVEVHARIEGEITQVYVSEGQWVEEGQPLAQLSNWQLQRNVEVTQAELDRARAVLERLMDGSTREEIALAKSKVSNAASGLKFKRSELDRFQKLEESGYATKRNLERVESEYLDAQADLDVAKANLEVVRAAATPAELDVARASVRQLESELKFRQEDIARTTIVAPASGAIVTANADLRRGKFLKVGDPAFEIEDNREARIEINLAESDVRFIEVGDRVQVKPRGFSNEIFIGKVVGIAPSADAESAGRVVRVMTALPNPDRKFRSQMSGYAKVEGEKMRLWRAYLLFLIRFFEVEVWSWIP